MLPGYGSNLRRIRSGAVPCPSDFPVQPIPAERLRHPEANLQSLPDSTAAHWRMPRMKQGTECLNVAASDGSHHGRYIGIAYFTHRNPPDSLFKNFLIPLSQLLRCRLDSLAAAVLCSLPPNAPEHILPEKVLGSFVLAIFFRQVVL